MPIISPVLPIHHPTNHMFHINIKFSVSKTELLIFPINRPYHSLSHSMSDEIPSSSCLGKTLESFLTTFLSYTTAYLQEILSVVPSKYIKIMTNLHHLQIPEPLSFFNNIITFIFNNTIHKTILLTLKSENVTSLLRTPQWIPTSFRVKLNVLTMVHNVLQKLTPNPFTSLTSSPWSVYTSHSDLLVSL